MSKEGDEILDGRQATYGDRKKNMQTMSDMYNAYLDGVEIRNGERRIEAFDFPMLMLLYKVYRFAVTPTYADNINDIDGYSAMAREMLGDSLIEAATAQEYQEKLEASKKQAPLPGVQETLHARCFNLGHTYTEDRTRCLACDWKKEEEPVELGLARLEREDEMTRKMPHEVANDLACEEEEKEQELIKTCQNCYGWYTNPRDGLAYLVVNNPKECTHPRHQWGTR